MTTILFKGQKTTLLGQIPAVQNSAKDFSLTNKDLTDVTLKDFQTKYIVIYTVPSLDTSICLLSTKKFNEEIGKSKDVSLLVVSADLPFACGRVCGSENLSNVHALSLMHPCNFAKDYGVMISDGPLRGLCARAVFVLDEERKITYVELVEEVTKEPSYAKVLSALK